MRSAVCSSNLSGGDGFGEGGRKEGERGKLEGRERESEGARFDGSVEEVHQPGMGIPTGPCHPRNTSHTQLHRHNDPSRPPPAVNTIGACAGARRACGARVDAVELERATPPPHGQ